MTRSQDVRLADVVVGRDNNLSLLRFIAATAVVYAHSFGLLGLTDQEPFYRIFGKGLGDVGVDIFFVISGLLITKSLLAKDSLGLFVWARVMRIYPALWLSTVCWVLVAGFLLSPIEAGEFFGAASTKAYILKNATMLPGVGAEPNLPHVFADGSPEFNAPLWTLPHELQMYALLAICGLIGLVRYRWMAMLIAGFGFACMAFDAFAIGVPIDPIRARFIFFFFTGSSLYLFRERIPLRSFAVGMICLCLGSAAVFSPSDPFQQLALACVTPYMAIWLAYVPDGAIRRYNEAGDYSYGIYILAFPLQLVLRSYTHIEDPWVLFAISMIAVLPAAMASWHLVESRALRLPAPRILDKIVRLNSNSREVPVTSG